MYTTSRKYKYTIYGKGSETVDCLTATYERIGFKTKLRLSNLQNEEVKLSQIRVNDISAHYFKGASFLPELQGQQKHQKKDNIYWLTFNVKEAWCCEEKALKKLSVFLLYGKEPIMVTVPTCCQIFGLKQFLEEHAGLPVDEHLLFYKNRPLNDENTLEECGIHYNDRIEIKTYAQLNLGPTSLQKATGSDYSSVLDFEDYVSQMREKIDIVCQISTPIAQTKQSEYGSGFLIGDYCIMTNMHVEPKKNSKATFFYHGNRHELLELDLDETPVCFSPSSGNYQFPSVQALDYVIFRLKPPKEPIHADLLDKFRRLNLTAEVLFNAASRRANSGGQTRERANIIQHPVVNEIPQPKHIAFRGNKIHSSDFLALHYKSKTLPGSSGSPVLNDEGEWIGLHFAECMVIQDKLYKYHEPLCQKLGYTFNKSSVTTHCYTKDKQALYIHLGAGIEGLCSQDKKGTEKFTFYQLILYHEKEIAKSFNLTTPFFILNFLQEHEPYIKPNLLEHLNCNTAIEVERIFDDLKNSEKGEALKVARRAAQEEWKEFADKQKSFFQKYRNRMIAAGGIVLGLFLGYKLLARKR